MLITLHAGHGSIDSGAVAANGTTESSLTALIAEATGAALEADGHEVLYSRRFDPRADSQAIARWAVNCGADLVLSIHCNDADNPQAHGIEILVPSHDTDASRRAAELAVGLAERLKAAFPDRRWRGVKPRPELAILRIPDASGIPAILLECGFMSNSAEESWLELPATHQALAATIAAAVAGWQ
jgi:N-acetylmuramoyl-L-alanine amidase